jgi:hypothetical protein
VRELDTGGLPEGGHGYALRIDAAHDVPNRPVLSRSIKSLKDHEERTAAFGIELVLEVGKAFEVSCPAPSCLLLAESGMVGRITIGQVEAGIRYAETLLEVHSASLSVMAPRTSLAAAVS